MNWKQEQEALENAYVRQLLIKYNIKETTTQRQAINGTREFEFPVPARKRYYNGKLKYSGERLRLACFKTGYVRNQNSCYSNYQLNPTYKRKKKWVFLESTGTVTISGSYPADANESSSDTSSDTSSDANGI